MTLRATIRRALDGALAEHGTLRVADERKVRRVADAVATEVCLYLEPPEGIERYDKGPSHAGLLVTAD